MDQFSRIKILEFSRGQNFANRGVLKISRGQSFVNKKEPRNHWKKQTKKNKHRNIIKKIVLIKQY